jgi:tetratricopeptide (TPR) repeat protein
MFTAMPASSRHNHLGRRWFLILAFVLTAAIGHAPSHAKPNEKTEAETKIEELMLRLELAEKLNATRLDAQDNKIRAADLKVSEDKFEAKKELVEIKDKVVANGQQMVNWWLASLALIGVVAPFLFTLNLRAAYKRQLEEVERAKNEIITAKKAIDEDRAAISNHLTAAEKDSAQIATHLGVTKNITLNPPNVTLNPSNEPTLSAAQQVAVNAVAESKDVSLAERLFAKGITAYKNNEFEKAAGYFASAVAEDPKAYEALYSWGVTLGKLSDIAEAGAKRTFQLQAISKYETLLKAIPDSHRALYNCSVVLSKVAGATKGDAQKQYLLQALDKTQAALKSKPDLYEAVHNWGAILSRLAEVSARADRLPLMLQAVGKYEAAHKMKPDQPITLDAWGGTLLTLARETSSVDEREKFCNEAEVLLLESQRITGYPPYNLASLAAFRSNAPRFIELVHALPKEELPSEEHLRSDKDLIPIYDAPEFKSWWKQRFASDAPTVAGNNAGTAR